MDLIVLCTDLRSHFLPHSQVLSGLLQENPSCWFCVAPTSIHLHWGQDCRALSFSSEQKKKKKKKKNMWCSGETSHMVKPLKIYPHSLVLRLGNHSSQKCPGLWMPKKWHRPETADKLNFLSHLSQESHHCS